MFQQNPIYTAWDNRIFPGVHPPRRGPQIPMHLLDALLSAGGEPGGPGPSVLAVRDRTLASSSARSISRLLAKTHGELRNNYVENGIRNFSGGGSVAHLQVCMTAECISFGLFRLNKI